MPIRPFVLVESNDNRFQYWVSTLRVVDAHINSRDKQLPILLQGDEDSPNIYVWVAVIHLQT